MKKEKIKPDTSTAQSERTTIVSKEGDSVAIEIRSLPNNFSFAYTFFRNIEQECRLLKREIEKAQNNGDKINVEYLKSAQKFFKEHPVPKNFYVGGISFSPILDVIQTLAFDGELLFTTSVAQCVKNRIEEEIISIHQEHEYCKAVLDIASSTDNIEKAIVIIREASTQEDAVEKLQSEMSLSAGAAECLCGVTLNTLCDKELIIQKVKSIKYLLGYLKYLKTVIS